MSTTIQNSSSVVSQYIAEAKTVPVGQAHLHPIDLPVLDSAAIRGTFGEQITHGDVGSIYRVKGCTPPRVYKIIPQDQFKDGDEIRISKTAGDLGVAPRVYSAFLAQQGQQNFVVIEMDDAGKSLGKWMEDLADNSEVAEKPEEEKELTAQEKFLKKLQAEMEEESGFRVVEIQTKKRVDTEVAIERLYPSKEAFYYAFFSNLKTLAENNISYRDSHVGNIMPNIGTDKGLQVIDFDSAKLMDSPKSAALETITSVYNQTHFMSFKKLENLSTDSKQLIDWFKL